MPKSGLVPSSTIMRFLVSVLALAISTLTASITTAEAETMLTAIRPRFANKYKFGFGEFLREWVIDSIYWNIHLTTWDWIFGWVVTVSWVLLLFFLIRGTGGLIRRKPKSGSNLVTDLKVLALGIVLSAAWYGICCLFAHNRIFFWDYPVIPLTAANANWWKLIPVTFALFKVETTLFRVGKTLVGKISRLPSEIADWGGDLIDSARDIAGED